LRPKEAQLTAELDTAVPPPGNLEQ
jgi:hypothetical protein